MSISRLKSLVIAILLLINLFFLTDIVWNRVSSAAELGRTLDSLQTVMAASGISFPTDSVSDDAVLEAYLTSQDLFAEAVIARAILNDCEPVQSDSGRQYSGFRGTALFNTRGEFVIELTEPYIPSGSSPERTVKKLLKSMDIVTDEPVLTTFGNTDVITALCLWNGSRIFNCTVTFEFSDGALLRVMGRRPYSISESQGGTYISFSTAMLSFLRQSDGLGLTAILSIDPGYRMNVGAFGDGELIPGWLIVTDSGTFFADASTGEIMRNDA